MPRPRRLSAQALRVLALLLQDPPAWRHGYDISRQTGLRSGTLYPILIRLADRGWLETRWAAPEREGRPARHTYRLTDGGLEAARAAAAPERPASRLLIEGSAG